MKKHLTHPVFRVIAEQALAMQSEAFVIGGYVRDIFLKRDSKDIDVVVTGHCPGPRVPLAITYPDPDEVGQVINGIRYVKLDWLIQLKLATRRWARTGMATASTSSVLT